MRKITFKNLQDVEKGQKNIFVAETLESEGILCHSERRSIYIVKEKVRIENPFNLEEEANKLQSHNTNPRQIFIHKKIDSQKKIKEFAYSILGRFYVVVGEEIYAIAFKHAFRLNLTDLGSKNKKDKTPEKKEEIP